MTRIGRLARFPAFFVRRRIFGQAVPLLADFKLTHRCNLACAACPFHLRAGQEEEPMGWEAALAALDRLERMGVLIVVFEGGEPCLWRDGRYGLGDLIEEAKRRFPRVAVTTNGTFPLDLPADLLWVSLDGLKGAQDRLRSGSFDRVWSNLRAATHHRIFVHFTLNRENRHDLRPLLAELKAVRAFAGMTLQLFYPYGQGEAPLALSADERRSVLEEAIALKRRGFPILNSSGRLRAMIDNGWRCRDDLLVNVDPDGTITRGCYVKSRGRVDCRACGFTALAEASGAIDLRPGSLRAGWSIFLKRR